VAAPLLDDPNLSDFDRDFLIPSVQANRSILQAAVKDLPSLKSIAITGSVNSMTTGSPDELKATAFTDATWSDITPDMARKAQNPYISYCSSKKEAELAAWEFVKTEKPNFGVTILLPALIFGPPIQPVKSVKKMNYSCDTFYKLFNGTFDEIPNTHSLLFPSYVDVRDLALAHVRALTAPGARNKRFLIGGKALSSKLIVDTLRHLSELSESEGGLPELKNRLPKDTGADTDVTPVRMDPTEGNTVLGLEGNLSSSEATFGDTARKILELEKKS
jgi:nucleoside-diphosphate-sugar epimerase